MFVEEVTVTSKEGDTVLFPCRCWLGKDDSNTKIIRELVPGKPLPEELEGKCNLSQISYPAMTLLFSRIKRRSNSCNRDIVQIATFAFIGKIVAMNL